MKYPAYPEYEDFSSESLDKCPKGWRNVAVKHCFDIQLGKMLQTKPESIHDIEMPYLKAQHVNWGGVNTDNLPLMWASPNDLEKYSVKNGDLLVCEGGEVGRASLLLDLEEDAIIQNALHRVRDDELGEVRFFSYMLRNLSSNGWFDILCNKATIAHLTGEKLAAIKIPLPSKVEQKKIAAFLDYKTQQIDQLIEKKKALIEKLNEQRIAVITQAVTKGLDKKAKMKPSGVDWLGDVPAHWGVMAIKFILDIPITDGPHETPEFLNEGITFISAEAVKNDRLDFDKKRGYISQEDHDRYSKKYKPKRGDVYMVKSGATTGNVARVETDEEFNIWSPLAVMRPAPELSTTDFIFYFTKSKPFFTSVELSWSYGTQQNIGMGVISNLMTTVPPVEEQKQITNYIDKEIHHIDGMLEKAQDVISRIQEYRNALITDAVTGKIDVRNIEIGEVA